MGTEVPLPPATTSTRPWMLALAVGMLAHAALPVSAASEGSASGYAAWPLWLLLLFCTSTVMLSAMYCGLTIGLLGMDTVSLEIIAEAGQEPDRTYARKILPVRLLGHQLLATLLVGNMLTMVLTSQLVAAILGASELVNFIVGTLIVLVFGEVIPMSFCNNQNNALWAGTKSLPALKISLFVMWPITKPLGLMLDWMVGHEAGQMYDRKELRKLIRLHCEKFSDKSGIDTDQVRMMLSAMDMNEVTVDAAMTPMEKAVMLEAGTRLDTALERRLWEHGISRVPVYHGTRDKVMGVLYVKDLIDNSYLGHNSEMTVRDFLLQHPRDMLIVKADTLLQDTLHIFEHRHTQLLFVEPADTAATATAAGSESERGSSTRSSVRRVRDTPLDPDTAAAAHGTGGGGGRAGGGGACGAPAHRTPKVITPMALFSDAAPPNAFVGIVTLEDVIEELIASEIYDEDEYSGGETLLSDADAFDGGAVVEAPPPRPPRVNFYSYGVPPRSEDQRLSEDQLWALAYYLTRAYVYFATWSVAHVKFLLQEVGDVVVHVAACDGESDEQNNSTSAPGIAAAALDLTTADPSRVLYRAGQPSSTFTLVLSGGVEVIIGREGLRTELRSFSELGEDVLHSDSPFLPDYTAVVSRTTRLVRITQADVAAAEKKLNEHRARRRQKPVRLVPTAEAAAVTVVATPTRSGSRSGRKEHMRGEDKRVTIE
ncbi:CBS domain containing protein [Novymonas esmeraldas]|uniref:CBS domain containing protein n=1 Tax=Novymonas esmeraldas TaxID=1808958 RepID=A0AAW0ERK3_9TRYP